jgi:hypothetical protein
MNKKAEEEIKQREGVLSKTRETFQENQHR